MEDFYVGYQTQAPPGVRRTVRVVVGALAASLGVLLGCALFAQPPFSDARFEYGESHDYEGTLVEWPYPMLVTLDGPYLLVSEGKFGMTSEVAGGSGRFARVRGTLIQRGPARMLQVRSHSLRSEKGAEPRPPRLIDLGSVTLTGEIVDTKCHLGVMKPGEGKVHRECATRCISGGVPPGFLVRDAAGETRLLLLTGSDGRALNRELLDFVAEPITIPGQLVRQGPTFILRAEPRDFRRE
jgi:hypothetical protein